MDAPRPLPLGHITVVSAEQAVSAPFATRQLADLGARVIKVERPGVGDFARAYDESVLGQSSHFIWLNCGKESVELDLKRSDDLALLHRIIDQADVFVQNLAPGAAERLGLGAAELRERRPALIHCSISGYGTPGPSTGRKAYDLMVQAEAGVLAVTGTPDSPAKAGLPVADIAAGMYCFTGILTALLDRERTGAGATVEVTMLEALSEWMGYPFYYSMGVPGGPPRSGARHASIAPYGPFSTGEGRTIFLAVQNEREWHAFCAHVLAQPELADDPRFARNSLRTKNREALEQVITGVFAKLTFDEVARRLDESDIANARMRNPAELLDHPQLQARQSWQQIKTPAGSVPALRHAVSFDGFKPAMGAVPRLGEHNKVIRAEFS
jgi:itaconate CoA-transferase